MRRFFAPLLVAACTTGAASSDQAPAPIPVAGPGQAVAVLAGGCFWCLESDLDKLPGVIATTSGYIGGHVPDPTYAMVTSEQSGHKEAVHVVYDTGKLTYDQVLDYYWHHVDPTDDGGQFCDRGDSYEPAIYPIDAAQTRAAEDSKKALQARAVLPGPVVVPVVPGQTFYAAEGYHQDFHHTNPGRYMSYRLGCGRDARVKQVWAKDAAP